MNYLLRKKVAVLSARMESAIDVQGEHVLCAYQMRAAWNVTTIINVKSALASIFHFYPFDSHILCFFALYLAASTDSRLGGLRC